MNQDQKENFLFYLLITSTIFTGASLLKIIHIPHIPPIAFQAIFYVSVFTLANNYRAYRIHQNDAIEVENSLKKLLQEQHSAQLEPLNTIKAKAQITSLLRTIDVSQKIITGKKLNQTKLKKPPTEDLQKQNIILASLALCIVRDGAIKFGNKVITTNKKDIVRINEPDNYGLPIIIERAASYLHNLQGKLGDNQKFSHFLNQLLRENNLFLDQSLGLTKFQTHFNTALSRFSKDLEKADRKEQEANKTSFRISPSPITINTQTFSSEINPIKNTPSTQEDLGSIDTSSLSTASSSESNDEIIRAISKTMLIDCGVESSCILEYQGNKLKLQANNNDQLPQFIKIFTNKINALNGIRAEGDNSFLIPHKSLPDLGGVLQSISREYQNSREYLGREMQLEAVNKAIGMSDKIRDRQEKEIRKAYFAKWEEFSNNHKIEEQENQNQKQRQELKLRNYQQFAKILNDNNYLQQLALAGDVYLKGSYLYKNLLNLNEARDQNLNSAGQDIDLEIHIPNLFSQFYTKEQIKKLISGQSGSKIKDQDIKINTKNFYIQVQHMTDCNKLLDLSFYDKNNLPENDWIYSVDALRLNITETLKSEQATAGSLLSITPSVSKGFALEHPNNSHDKLLTKIANGDQDVNMQARSLLFNTVKRIARGAVTANQVKSLYQNNEKFREACDGSWNLFVRDLNKLQNRCKDSGIDIDNFYQIRTEIMTNKTIDAKSAEKPTAQRLGLGMSAEQRI